VGWLGKLPIVSLLIAGAMFVAPSGLVGGLDSSSVRFETARAEARAYVERNPELVIDPLGERMLDPVWLAETREIAEGVAPPGGIELPPRMQARSQNHLDELIEAAYQARLASEPAWRLGVLDAQTPGRNYLAHAFIHESIVGILVCVAVLLLVGAPLERAWGSLVFAGFALSSIPITAQAFRFLDGASGVPWSGSAGLAGALIGAYFIRGLGGHFVLPGWVLLPAWLAAESLWVRSFSLDHLQTVPWATLIAAIGLGALFAGAMRLLGVEARLDSIAASRMPSGPNPIVARAARLRSDGDPYRAFDLIQAAWREEPLDTEVAEAFFAIAVEVGQPGAAAEAIVPSVRAALKSGDVARALEYWLPLAKIQSGVSVGATAAVRLGEALLDAGHPEEAVFSLRSALDAGVSPAHATRIVHIARDLDEDLARRAAHVALADPTLDPRSRAELEPIATPARVDFSGESQPDTESDSERDNDFLTDLDSEHDSDLLADLDSDLGPDFDPADALDLDFTDEASPAASWEALPVAQDLDPNALSAESLGADDAPSVEIGSGGEDPHGDVLSHWNAQGSREDPEDERAGGVSPTDSRSIDPSFALDLGQAGDFGSLDPREAETDSDMTPMMTIPDADESSGPGAGPVATDFVVGPVEEDEKDLAVVMPEAFAPPPLRILKAIEAVPVGAGNGWIEIDVEPRRRSKLPLHRIQAIGMAAVSGLNDRPVLVIDFILNWNEGAGEPLKVVRFRSDRFDPRRFEPSTGTPLAALTAWVGRLQSRSNARCLPSRDILGGRFERFDCLAAYEREVLLAVSEG
jgi:hypothetical protein